MRKKKERVEQEADGLKSLPRNRKEVFFDFIKHRKMTLFALSSFTFMFFIPLAVDLFYFNFLESVASQNGQTDALFSLIFYSMLIMIPCMVLGFIGLTGAFYVAKKMAWQEGIMLASDFFKGIKENWLHGLIDGLLFGISLFGLVVGGLYLYSYAPVHASIKGIGIGGLILVFLVLGIVTALNMTQSVYYANSYLKTFKNSFSFLAVLNWKVLVLFLLSTGAVFTLCCFNMILLGVGLFLFAILNSVVVVLYTLIAHSAFDKYINQVHYPEYVGKGLYKEKIQDSPLENEEA